MNSVLSQRAKSVRITRGQRNAIIHRRPNSATAGTLRMWWRRYVRREQFWWVETER